MPSPFARYKQRVVNRLTYNYEWLKNDAMPWCNENLTYIRKCMEAGLTPYDVAKLFDDARKDYDAEQKRSRETEPNS